MKFQAFKFIFFAVALAIPSKHEAFASKTSGCPKSQCLVRKSMLPPESFWTFHVPFYVSSIHFFFLFFFFCNLALLVGVLLNYKQ